jgi:hypothetical protein
MSFSKLLYGRDCEHHDLCSRLATLDWTGPDRRSTSLPRPTRRRQATRVRENYPSSSFSRPQARPGLLLTLRPQDVNGRYTYQAGASRGGAPGARIPRRRSRSRKAPWVPGVAERGACSLFGRVHSLRALNLALGRRPELHTRACPPESPQGRALSVLRVLHSEGRLVRFLFLLSPCLCSGHGTTVDGQRP